MYFVVKWNEFTLAGVDSYRGPMVVADGRGGWSAWIHIMELITLRSDAIDSIVARTYT